MTPRPYRLGRRAESAEETLRRIVRATYTLHCEQGVAATTMKQIARRADVSVGTVYHHFARPPWRSSRASASCRAGSSG
jgi:AcrR family transcriptional regulator